MHAQYMSLTWFDGIQLLRGIGVTLSVTFLSIIFGTLLGSILGLIRCSRNKIISALPLIFIEPLRNSPLVVQLFMVYFGLPVVARIVLNPYPAAVITISLNTAAFFAVLVHSSIKAVPEMQWQAGYALGHDRMSTFIHIIARQAIRILVPGAITLYLGGGAYRPEGFDQDGRADNIAYHEPVYRAGHCFSTLLCYFRPAREACAKARGARGIYVLNGGDCDGND
jgi:His/Glu/Gln/Arg/opine family amino acid ABC transporter permease subunit